MMVMCWVVEAFVQVVWQQLQSQWQAVHPDWPPTIDVVVLVRLQVLLCTKFL
jgi:hypothetical protein